MKIKITMDLADEFVDEEHAMGVTEEFYMIAVEKLGPYGDDIDITPDR